MADAPANAVCSSFGLWTSFVIYGLGISDGFRLPVLASSCFFRHRSGYAFVFAKTVLTQAWLSRYQRTVSRMPSSNLCAGVQPSSRWIFDASMA